MKPAKLRQPVRLQVELFPALIKPPFGPPARKNLLREDEQLLPRIHFADRRTFGLLAARGFVAPGSLAA
jgi:hypothetical protein